MAFDVDSYDEIRFNCTIYSTGGKLFIASFFKKATGSMKIGVPSGDTLVTGSPITFVSGDGSVTLTGDDSSDEIDIRATASGSSLDGLTDVTLGALTNDEVLMYNSSTTEWENSVPSSTNVSNSSSVTGSNVTSALDTLDTRTYDTQFYTETITLDATDISNKYIILSSAPVTKETTQLSVIGGTTQFYSIDYTVTNDDSGKRLTWTGLNLDGILSIGDQLVVIHN